MSGFAERTKHIQSFRVMAILAEARQREAAGEDIIHLEVGEPDFPTPRPIIEAATQALNAGRTGYTPALGLPALREALAGYYQQRFAVSLNPKRIVLAPGASGALLLLTAARLNPGDGLLLADPGYPCNHHFGHLFGAHPQRISCGAEQQYLLTASDIDSHWQAHTKAALVASPANPTGAVYSPTQMQALVVAVSRQGGDLWVDEIYQELHFSDAVNHSPMTALQVSDEVVVINSFSKYFGMTGWRLGWAVIPEAWVETFDTLAQNLFLAPPTPAQYGALAALQPASLAICEERRVILSERYHYLSKALIELGFRLPHLPQGGLYIYVDIRAFSDNSLEFCQRMLADIGVATTPGIDFSASEGRYYVRFAFTAELSRLQQAVDRLAAWLPLVSTSEMDTDA